MALALLGAIGCSVIGNSKIPSDEQMEAKYKAHRKEMERILELGQKARRPISLNIRTPFNEHIELSKAEWNDLQRSLKDIECENFRSPFLGNLRVFCFGFSAYGNVSGGWYKGVAYTEDSPEKLYEDLSEIPRESGRMEMLLKPIEGNWYVFLQAGG